MMKDIFVLDLLDYRPVEPSILFDIKMGLTHGTILVEREFRSFLAGTDWEIYKDKPVAIQCTEDAVVPQWAYMSVTEKLQGIASDIAFAEPETMDVQLWSACITSADFSRFKGQKVVVRQDQLIPPELYVVATCKLKPLVATLMYGEVGLPKVIFKSKEK